MRFHKEQKIVKILEEKTLVNFIVSGSYYQDRIKILLFYCIRVISFVCFLSIDRVWCRIQLYHLKIFLISLGLREIFE